MNSLGAWSSRLFSALLLMAALATFTFFLLRLAPGGPFDSEKIWPPEIQHAILERYGLDLSLAEQFSKWFSQILRGDLGESFQYLGRSVSSMLIESFPVSFHLGMMSLLFAIVMGLGLGLLGALFANSALGFFVSLLIAVGVSFPSYLLAAILIWVSSFYFNFLPPALWEGPAYWILPTLTLAARPTTLIARLLKLQLNEAASSDYIRTAISKGLSPESAMIRHALKNALIPVLSLLGPLSAQLITGSFLVEMVFQIPGMGRFFVQAVLNRDYPLVMGVTLFYGGILIASTAMADFVSEWADPRMRIFGDPSE